MSFVVQEKKVSYNFYTYLFKGMDSMKLFHGMGSGIRLTLSFKELKRQLLPVPPEEEQDAIVFYLDIKCSSIEILLANKKKENHASSRNEAACHN